MTEIGDPWRKLHEAGRTADQAGVDLWVSVCRLVGWCPVCGLDDHPGQCVPKVEPQRMCGLLA